MLKFKVNIPVYNTAVHFVVAESIAKIASSFPSYEKYIKEIEGDYFFDDATGLFIIINNKRYVFLEDTLDTNTVIHEILHATINILTEKGVRLTDSSEEAYCYLHGYLFSEYSKKIQKLCS